MERRLRLRRAEDFFRLRKNGTNVRNHSILLSYIPNDLDSNRYGFVTSGHIGNAVVRNRVRRLLREAVRQLHPRLESGYDIVFIARQPLFKQSFTTVKQLVVDLLMKAGLVVVESVEP